MENLVPVMQPQLQVTTDQGQINTIIWDMVDKRSIDHTDYVEPLSKEVFRALSNNHRKMWLKGFLNIEEVRSLVTDQDGNYVEYHYVSIKKTSAPYAGVDSWSYVEISSTYH